MTMGEAVFALSVAISLVLLAIWLWQLGESARKGANLPDGEIVSADTMPDQHRTEILYAPSICLSGKPDYLVRRNGGLVPVELKSSPAPEKPYDSHLIQLVAYCYLVEENYGIRPKYGILQYRDATFRVPYTDELETWLVETVQQMQKSLLNGEEVDRNHQHFGRCAHCGVRDYCDQRLEL